MSEPLAGVLWNIPHQRNPFFTGREDILRRLDRALHAEQRVALSQPQGVTGLGGIGKTQTVVEYAYRHREEYEAILWVRADSINSLISSMVELAQILELPERHEQKQDVIVQAVLRWLRLHSNWLLIYDNIDDLSLAEPFLPRAGTGHLLFTTRAHALGGLAQRLDIARMDPEIGALLLLRRASLLALQAPLHGAKPDEQRLAQVISQKLDGLPLALDQAGAYVRETPCSLAEYLTRYQTRQSDLLQTRGRLHQDYPASVATTWSLSFEKISQAYPAALEVLNFCAFLAPDAIPEDLLKTGTAHLGEHLAPVVANPLEFDQICKEILRFSLLQRSSDEQTLTVHRLVQAVIRDTMPARVQQQWMQQAVLTVNAALPAIEPAKEFASWASYEPLVAHALICATWIKQASLTMPESSRLLDQTGVYLVSHARYTESELLLKQALAIRKQRLGDNHPDTAMSLNNLGMHYYSQGKLTQAKPLHEQALAIRKQKLGDNHPDTAMSLNNLASWYSSQEQFEQAKPLYECVLAIYEQTSKTNHSTLAIALNNLATLYDRQGNFEQAEPLYKRALAIRKQELGDTHFAVAAILNNLAVMYDLQGKDTQAEALHKQALEIRKQELGDTHPDIAESMQNLALLYHDQKKYAEAAPLLEQSLAILEQRLGDTHPDVASTLDNLATLYYHQERQEQIKSSLPTSALLYKSQGKYEQAERLYKRALAIDMQTFGANHLRTALLLNNLGKMYCDLELYKAARPLLKKALAIHERRLGSEHAQTQLIRENYVRLIINDPDDEELPYINGCVYIFISCVFLIIWLFHRSDLFGSIALVLAVLSSLPLAIRAYRSLLRRARFRSFCLKAENGVQLRAEGKKADKSRS